MRRLLMGLILTGAIASRLLAAEAITSGRFGQALDTTRGVASAAANPAYDVCPLTVECWAKLNGAKTYNIVIANEAKASQTHWEFFSLPNTGCFAAYLPGNKPDFVGTKVPITDGQWHYLAMVADAASVRLWVDGKEAASVKVTRPANPKFRARRS